METAQNQSPGSFRGKHFYLPCWWWWLQRFFGRRSENVASSGGKNRNTAWRTGEIRGRTRCSCQQVLKFNNRWNDLSVHDSARKIAFSSGTFTTNHTYLRQTIGSSDDLEKFGTALYGPEHLLRYPIHRAPILQLCSTRLRFCAMVQIHSQPLFLFLEK